MKAKLRIIQLFRSYPLFYQPYLAALLDHLNKDEVIDQIIASFESISTNDSKLNTLKIPDGKHRKLKEIYWSIRYKQFPKLDYLAYLCLRKNADILHVQHSFLNYKLLKVFELPSAKRPKIIITLRGDDTYLKPWVSKKWEEFYATYSKKVDAYIVMSNHQKAYLQKWGVHKDKIYVIPISIENSALPKSKTRDNKTIKICSAFRFSWEKNIEAAIRTIKVLKERGHKVEYKIFGGGSYNPTIQVKYFIDKYNVADEVEICGEVENTELKKILRLSDFYLQLSYSESLGMAVIEAQSAGLPAIVSNSGGLPEVVKNGLTGYCVDAWDAEEAATKIIDLWQDETKYLQFSKEAVAFSRSKFSTEKEKNSLVQLYKHLVNQ